MLDYSDDEKENAEYFWTIDKGCLQKNIKMFGNIPAQSVALR